MLCACVYMCIMDCMWLYVCVRVFAFVQVERMKPKGGVMFVVVFQCYVSVCVCVECVCAVSVHDGL